MNETALTVRNAEAGPDRLTNLQRLGQLLAESGYFADARDMAQAAVKVMAGEELGIPPIASMMGVNIIQGKVALGANLIASRIRAHGYEYRVKRLDNTGCVIEFLRGDQVLGESSFTEEDAKAAGLLGKGGPWKSYPRNMYFARAISNGARWFTPEIFGGAPVYTPEELGAPVDEDGNVIHQAQKVDTGGHPAGTKEAQEYVKQRRLEEVRQAAPAVEEYGRGPAQGGNGNGAQQANADIPEDVQKLWGMMRNFQSILQVFGQLKASLARFTGSDERYYSILKEHGMEHANDCRKVGMSKTRQCARALFEAAQAAQVSQAQAQQAELGLGVTSKEEVLYGD